MLPQYVLDRFARIPHDTPIDNKYYGVFYQILQTVCFPEHHFTVEPRYPFSDLGVMDSVLTYVVEVNDLPIFLLEIKSPLHIDLVSTRANTDAEMRARFLALYEDISIPSLHGVSAMGQRLAFYYLDKATSRLTPSYVAPSSNTDSVLVERWDTDITTEDGSWRLSMTSKKWLQHYYDRVCCRGCNVLPSQLQIIVSALPTNYPMLRYLGDRTALAPVRLRTPRRSY